MATVSDSVPCPKGRLAIPALLSPRLTGHGRSSTLGQRCCTRFSKYRSDEAPPGNWDALEAVSQDNWSAPE